MEYSAHDDECHEHISDDGSSDCSHNGDAGPRSVAASTTFTQLIENSVGEDVSVDVPDKAFDEQNRGHKFDDNCTYEAPLEARVHNEVENPFDGYLGGAGHALQLIQSVEDAAAGDHGPEPINKRGGFLILPPECLSQGASQGLILKLPGWAIMWADPVI